MLRLEILQTIDVPPLIFLQRNLEAVQKRGQLIAEVTFHDLRHDFAHRARQAGSGSAGRDACPSALPG
jgi:integrase